MIETFRDEIKIPIGVRKNLELVALKKKIKFELIPSSLIVSLDKIFPQIQPGF